MEDKDYTEEISLKEILEIVLKRKKVIILSVALCILIGVILSFFVIKPVYESKSTYLVNPIAISSGINPNSTIILSADMNSFEEVPKTQNKMLGSILKQIDYPQFDVTTMTNYMRSSAYLTNILKTYNIDLEKYDYKKQIGISSDPQTGLLGISVKFEDANTAIKIRNDIIDNLLPLITLKTNEKIQYADKFITAGIDNEMSNKKLWEDKLFQFMQSIGASGINNLSPSQQNEYENINSNLLLSKQSLDAYQLINKELDNIKKLDIKTMMNLQQIYDDQLPLEPISPHKIQNLAIAMMLGLMLGIFLTFILDFLNKNFGLKV